MRTLTASSRTVWEISSRNVIQRIPHSLQSLTDQYNAHRNLHFQSAVVSNFLKNVRSFSYSSISAQNHFQIAAFLENLSKSPLLRWVYREVAQTLCKEDFFKVLDLLTKEQKELLILYRMQSVPFMSNQHKLTQALKEFLLSLGDTQVKFNQLIQSLDNPHNHIVEASYCHLTYRDIDKLNGRTSFKLAPNEPNENLRSVPQNKFIRFLDGMLGEDIFGVMRHCLESFSNPDNLNELENPRGLTASITIKSAGQKNRIFRANNENDRQTIFEHPLLQPLFMAFMGYSE
jgi:hypothetical protein